MGLELKNFHTFGDSHSSFGWRKIDGIKKNHLGPVLCYSFGKEGLKRLNIKSPKYGVKDGDSVCFSFGEIDCRCHVHKYDTKETPYNVIIDNMVENYLKAIKENVLQFKKLNVFVFNVVPPLKDNHLVVIKNKNNKKNPFPFLGDEKQRKTYVNYFNQKLKDGCLDYGYIFLDVYKDYSDEEGFLLEKHSDGHVHIDNPIYIKKFLNKYE